MPPLLPKISDNHSASRSFQVKLDLGHVWQTLYNMDHAKLQLAATVALAVVWSGLFWCKPERVHVTME